MLYVVCLSLIAILGIGLFWLSQNEVAEAQNNAETPHPLAAINQKAKDARKGDETAAADLVDEMIRVAAFETEFDGFTTDTVKERVAKAESRYRQGLTEGIPTVNIAQTVNGLAYKFDLPKYAKTNVNEVNRLRMMLLPNFPQIITRNTEIKQALAVGTKFDSNMSPAEAFFVLMMMFQQKRFNPEYQLTSSERLSLWKEIHNHRPGANAPKLPENRNEEIRAALESAGNSMSISEASNLSDITLNTLGIEQEGGKGQ